jgi:hypothetical protein
VGGGGFVLGVTAGGLSDAFLLGAAGAVAVATVSALIGGVRWLLTLDTRLAAIRDDMAAGFEEATAARAILAGGLTGIDARVAAIETELTTNGGHDIREGGTVRDAVERIDRRSCKVAEQVGALDYDDEDD